MTAVTGSIAAAAPFMPISALKIAAAIMSAIMSRVSVRPHRRNNSGPRPGTHARGRDRDREQGGDQDHHRVAETGHRLLPVKHAGEVQGERGSITIT
jgi:hypothetical protein